MEIFKKLVIAGLFVYVCNGTAGVVEVGGGSERGLVCGKALSQGSKETYELSYPVADVVSLRTYVLAGVLQHYVLGEVKRNHRGFSQRFYTPSEDSYRSAEELIDPAFRARELEALANIRSFDFPVRGSVENMVVGYRSGDIKRMLEVVNELLAGDFSTSPIAADLYFTSLLLLDVKPGTKLLLKKRGEQKPVPVVYRKGIVDGVSLAFLFENNLGKEIRLPADEILSLNPQ